MLFHVHSHFNDISFLNGSHMLLQLMAITSLGSSLYLKIILVSFFFFLVVGITISSHSFFGVRLHSLSVCMK